jgi:hypothetical protein
MQKKSPPILTPTTGNIIFKISGLLELQVKVNGQQVEFNALTCIDKASKLVKLISNNTSCAKNISAQQYQTIHNVLRTLVHANLNTIHSVLRTLVHTSPPHNMAQARDIINELTTAMHAMQTPVATTVGSSPGSLAFLRDIF